LAPLHNPANLQGITTCQELIPKASQIAVFDTAFYQSMSITNYLYPIPIKYYKNDKIRKYGFHGTSHDYVTHKACKLL
jgi:acetate kinase